MTSHVVFGEGRNEVYFMHRSIKKCNDDPSISNFVAEDLDGKTASFGEEENALRNFRRATDVEYLVKSEGGYSDLYPIFAYSCEKILTGQIECTLVADLDEGPIDDLESDLQEELDDQFGGTVQWQEKELRDTVGDLRTWSVTLADTELSISTEINLVTFDDDLEAAVGCSSDDSRSKRNPEIRDYAARTPVRRAFIDLYD